MKRMALVTVGFALLVGACGSDDEGSSASGGGGGGGDAASSCVSQAAEVTKAAKAEIELKAPSGPLQLGDDAGKTLWLVNVTETPLVEEVSSGFRAAAKAAGMEAQVFDAKGAVNQMNAGISQAVAQDAAGIAILGIAPAVVEKPLADAEEAGIPVVDIFNGNVDRPLENGLFAHVDADYTESGKALASWILEDSKCKSNTAILGAKVLQVHTDITKGAQDQFKALCPDCKSSVGDVDLAKLATDAGRSAQTLLRRDPNVNYLFPVFDGAVTFVGPAVQQAGADVKIVSHDGVAANLAEIRKGGGQLADAAFPPSAWIAWAAVDQLGRAIGGEEAADWSIPIRLVDKTNAGQSDEDIFPAYQDYEAAFTKAWGGGA